MGGVGLIDDEQVSNWQKNKNQNGSANTRVDIKQHGKCRGKPQPLYQRCQTRPMPSPSHYSKDNALFNHHLSYSMLFNNLGLRVWCWFVSAGVLGCCGKHTPAWTPNCMENAGASPCQPLYQRCMLLFLFLITHILIIK